MRRDLPLVSIITPSYNQGKFIEDTLLSVKNQDYPNIEHIVVDGGSTDNTLKILRKYGKEYNLIWISEPDEGQSDAVNKGFEMAKGEIIGWLNSDDVYFDKRTISYVIEQFVKNPDADVIYGDSVIIDEDNFIKRVWKVPIWNYNRSLKYCSFITQPATFFDKSVIKEKIDKKLEFSMDIEFWLRLGGKNYNFYHVNKILAGDRLHKGTKRLSNPKAHMNESRKVREKYGQSFGFIYYHYCVIVVRLFTGILRVRGVKDILKIENTDKLAFNAKLESRLSRIKSQLY